MDGKVVQFTPDTQKKALEAAEELDARIYIYSGDIDGKGLSELILSSDFEDKRTNTVLILTTLGGSANAAYQIARFIQETSDNFYLSVPAYCKSAGTLLALGAHKLFMTIVSELGPLDVQLPRRDDIGQPRSGMVIGTAFEGLTDECYKLFEKIMLDIKKRSRYNISFETASRIASDIVSGVMAPVYAQINPDSLGNDLRDLRVAQAYGERLAKFSNNVKPLTVRELIRDYPSHDFIIDQREASELFKNVEEPPESLSVLISEIGPYVYTEQEFSVIDRLDRPFPTDSKETTEDEPENTTQAPDNPPLPDSEEDVPPKSRRNKRNREAQGASSDKSGETKK